MGVGLGVTALVICAGTWRGTVLSVDELLSPVWSDVGSTDLAPQLAAQPLLARAWAVSGAWPDGGGETGWAVVLPRSAGAALSRDLRVSQAAVARAVVAGEGGCAEGADVVAGACESAEWLRVNDELPGVLAELISSDGDVRAEAVELACVRPELAWAVREALVPAEGWPAVAAQLLEGCAKAGLSQAGAVVDRLPAVRAGQPAGSGAGAETLGGVLDRYAETLVVE